MLSSVVFLVVEDQPAIREIVTEILKSAGAKAIHHATDGATALASIRDNKPDIVITDMLMAGMDGLDLVRLVRGSADSPNPFLPIVMLTARTDLKFVFEARDAGVTEFASKPITVANLLRRISAVITHPRPFIRSSDYFGPCRRRRPDPDFKGERKRSSDAVTG